MRFYVAAGCVSGEAGHRPGIADDLHCIVGSLLLMGCGDGREAKELHDLHRP